MYYGVIIGDSTAVIRAINGHNIREQERMRYVYGK